MFIPIFGQHVSARQSETAKVRKSLHPYCSDDDVKQAVSFLFEYSGSQDTYNTYRRELERLYQWSWLVRNLSVVTITRQDIVDYTLFFKDPPADWFSVKRTRRFLTVGGELRSNSEWRPFVKTDKLVHQSPASLKSMLAVLSTFYEYLLQESIVQRNPVKLIRKHQLIQKQQETIIHRQLNTTQWVALLQAVKLKTLEDDSYERHLFILSCFFLLGLRISELASSTMQSPTMSQFYQDHSRCWWFQTVGKGNKSREVAVPDDCLTALVRYRRFLGLTDLPMFNDHSPLLPKDRGRGSLGIRRVRTLVKDAFSAGVDHLNQQGKDRDALMLKSATAHWLRHTAIAHDVSQNRPLTDIRDDAGHQSINTTNIYLQSSRKERYLSAKKKQLKPQQEGDDGW